MSKKQVNLNCALCHTGSVRDQLLSFMGRLIRPCAD